MYLIGTIAFISKQFPDLDLTDNRHSLDGAQVVIETEVPPELKSALEKSGTFCGDASETRVFLARPESAGVWYKSKTAPVVPDSIQEPAEPAKAKKKKKK